VRGLLTALEVPLLWGLFFLTSVYGHVAVRLAVPPGGDARRALAAAATSFWGWSAAAAWGLSCVLWVVAVSRHALQSANAVSSLRYVLIALAAWSLFGERLGPAQWLGMLLIAGGILLVK
jgi:drug/metabolite transporter (DMT)-like permease